jgi:Zn finger protein HypA/HybF involved in hydrogenase expression
MCKACMPQYKNYSSEEIGKEGAMLTISNDELEKKRAWKGEDLPCPKCGRVLKVIIDGNSVTKPAAEVLLGAVSCEPCRGSFLVVIEGRVVHHG